MANEEKQEFTIENYYREKSPKKRLVILDALTLKQEDQEGNLRRKLYEMRYEYSKKRPQNEPADRYFILLMTMKMSADNGGGGLFGKRGLRKELRGYLEKTGIATFSQGDELQKGLLYQELYHMAVLYIDSCLTDTTYTSTLMGMMRLTDQQVKEKITKDIYKIAYMLPERLDMTSEFELFAKACTDAFCSVLPEWESALKGMLA